VLKYAHRRHGLVLCINTHVRIASCCVLMHLSEYIVLCTNTHSRIYCAACCYTCQNTLLFVHCYVIVGDRRTKEERERYRKERRRASRRPRRKEEKREGRGAGGRGRERERRREG